MNIKVQFSFFCLFASLYTGSAFGQNPAAANEAFDKGNYIAAMEAYSRLIEKEPDNPDYNYRLGISYLRTNRAPVKALDYLVKRESLGKYNDELLLQIAKAYTYHLQYEESRRYLDRYEKESGVNKKEQANFDRLMAVSNAGPELLKYPVSVEFTNPGASINSPYPDYHPFISRNGKELLFTSRRKAKPGSRPEFDGYFPSDIYRSTYANGLWQEAARLSDRINTVYDEQSVGLSSTADTLFIYVDHVEDFGDIYTSIKKSNAYGEPIKLENAVNSPFVESACSISKDGKTMVFSSNRDGGVGQLDIWMTVKNKAGKWEEAKNLGDQINSAFDEDFPTLSDDGKTLFFCSEGLPGMGGFDLFFSAWDEQGKSWTKPQNLGYPVNSPSDEKNISFAADGRTAVMTALRMDSYGDLDVYSLAYSEPEKDSPAIFLINVPVSAIEVLPEVQIRNQFDEPVGNYSANKLTGNHTVALYPGKYFIYVDAEGYKPYTEALVVSEFHRMQDQNVRVINLKK